MNKRILEFVKAILHHSGILFTGGFFIGLVNLWQLTGHNVRPAVGWAIAMVALLAACFRAWNEQAQKAENAGRATAASAKPDIRISLSAEGTPPSQTIKVVASQRVKILRLEYML